MFVYGRLAGINTSKLARLCIEDNVFFVPGSEFNVASTRKDEIRFNFTSTSKEEVVKGLSVIQKNLKHCGSL